MTLSGPRWALSVSGLLLPCLSLFWYRHSGGSLQIGSSNYLKLAKLT